MPPSRSRLLEQAGGQAGGRALTAAPRIPHLPAELTDALDIWVEATGLLHEAECDQEEQEQAEAGRPTGKSGGGRLRRAASWIPPWRQ